MSSGTVCVLAALQVIGNFFKMLGKHVMSVTLCNGIRRTSVFLLLFSLDKCL